MSPLRHLVTALLALALLLAPAVPSAASQAGFWLDRTEGFDGGIAWLADDTTTVGSALNFSNAQLPAVRTLDTTSANAGAAAEVARQARVYGTFLNTGTYTSPLTIVDPATPLEPVGCPNCSKAMAEVAGGLHTDGSTYLGGGFPIPPGFVAPDPAVDTDGEVSFSQPDYINPCTGWKGRLYEAWRFRPSVASWTDAWGVAHRAYDPSRPISPANPRYVVSSVGRALDMAHNPGHYVAHGVYDCNYSQPGHPDSAWEAEGGLGVTAAQTLLVNDLVSREDCVTGKIDHAVGLLVKNGAPGYVWPAQHGDGTNPAWPVQEGVRLALPAGLAKPSGLTRLASMLFDAAQNHGFVVDDHTFGVVGVRIEAQSSGVPAPECDALRDGRLPYQALAGFPWASLQVLAVGSDSDPNP